MQQSEARDYYVSLRRGEGEKARYSLLAGPFATRDDALKFVTPAKQQASHVDPWSDFDAIGTCSIIRKPDNKMGFMNVYLNVTPRELEAT